MSDQPPLQSYTPPHTLEQNLFYSALQKNLLHVHAQHCALTNTVQVHCSIRDDWGKWHKLCQINVAHKGANTVDGHAELMFISHAAGAAFLRFILQPPLDA